ncbi:protein kinase domain-containing protein [Pendulispora albinea]|uniref:non-specific serine/threonine protein kinase n=1 Tax=Pendulispora albinea TaxID=2741071 RepID=A0ABZ2LRN6_9BACT
MTDNFEYPSGILIPGTKYKVIRRLGAGGMGTVYEVEDTNIEKRYVLKTLHASLSSRADLAERMRREARALARLEHRNIVQVITADVTADSLRLTYLVMEKLNGHTLRTVLDNKTRLNVDTACRLSIDLLNALYHAHENRIIHRDVKPENIFLHRDADGTTVTKLLDFGIMTEADPETHTQTGHNRFIGTLRYAAPEQLTGRPITAQTDIYAAGLCLYEIITGYGPFDDLTSTAEIANAHIATLAPPISKHVRVPRQLEDIVRRALAKDPADRQHDAFTFAAELNRFRKSQQGALDLAPLSQVETVADPFHLSTDPGLQQRVAISGGGRPMMAMGNGQAAVQAATPQPVRSAEGGSGVRSSSAGHPARSGSHSSSDPGHYRGSALADAATEFDEGDAPGAPYASGMPSHLIRGVETHENASAPPMTANGPTPVPAAALRAGLAQPPVDRSAPTGTYAPPGAGHVQRSGTALMSAVDAPYPSDLDGATQLDGHPPTQTLQRQPSVPDARLHAEAQRTSAMPAAGPHAPTVAASPAAKRGMRPELWIVIAGSAIGAILAIGLIYYHLSTRGAKVSSESGSSATPAAAAPTPVAANTTEAAPVQAKASPSVESAAATVDAGAAAATKAAEPKAETKQADSTDHARTHRAPREAPRTPTPATATQTTPPAKKLPGSGL